MTLTLGRGRPPAGGIFTPKTAYWSYYDDSLIAGEHSDILVFASVNRPVWDNLANIGDGARPPMALCRRPTFSRNRPRSVCWCWAAPWLDEEAARSVLRKLRVRACSWPPACHERGGRLSRRGC